MDAVTASGMGLSVTRIERKNVGRSLLSGHGPLLGDALSHSPASGPEPPGKAVERQPEAGAWVRGWKSWAGAAPTLHCRGPPTAPLAERAAAEGMQSSCCSR